MKNMKTRIAAVLFAAATTVCASQAITANAFARGTNSQDWCEFEQNMGYTIRGWSRYCGINAGSYWNQNVTSGAICKTNFKKGSFSGQNNGTVLSGSQALCRFLANSFFGTQTYMEHIVYGNTKIQMGDQIRLGQTRSSSQKTLFVAYVTGNKFETYSLNNSTHIIERNTYRKKASNSFYLQRIDANGNVLEDNIYMDFLIRPIKEGDVNGDGTFTTADKTWLEQKIGSQPSAYPKNANTILNPSTYATEIFIRAALGREDTWSIEYSTYYTIGRNLNLGGGCGRMVRDGNNDYYYVIMNSNG